MKPNHKNEIQGHLFNTSWLEFLSKASPRFSASFYVLIIGILLTFAYRREIPGDLLTGVFLFLIAFIFWTLFEYVAHRYIFHLDHYFPDSKLAQRVSYIFHGIHHEYPRDTQRLIMPPAPGLLIIMMLFLFGRLLIGKYIFICLAGFLTGYLVYTFIHYKTHVTPVPSFLKQQYRHHALHHYKYQDRAFGVSSPFWDWVFGTMPPTSNE